MGKKINLVELGTIGLEAFHLIESLRGTKDLKEMLGKIKTEADKGNLDGIKKVIKNIDINTFVDENLYSDALAELPPNIRAHIDHDLMGPLSRGTKAEKELHRNTIACIATNPNPERRMRMLEEIAACKNVDELKQLIYARGWDRPDQPIENVAKKIAGALKKHWPAIKNAIKKTGQTISNSSKQTIDEIDADMSGFAGWAARLKERAKRQYYEGK